MVSNNNSGNMRKDNTDDIAIPSATISKKSNIQDKLMKQIISSLKVNSDSYRPLETIISIKLYNKYSNRILYSSFTSNIFSIAGTNELDSLMSNIDTLKNFTFASNNKEIIPDSIKNIVIKLWDHCHLAEIQINTINGVLDAEINKITAPLISQINDQSDKIEDKFTNITKKFNTIENEFNNMVREYITILGIFASIIVSFVAGITFSTSVLENMNNVSIFRLSFVILFLAFVLLNAVHMLIYYIFKLNNPSKSSSSLPINGELIKYLNKILLVIFIVLAVFRVLRLDNFYIPFENTASFVKYIQTNIGTLGFIVSIIISFFAGVAAKNFMPKKDKNKNIKTVTGSDQS